MGACEHAVVIVSVFHLVGGVCTRVKCYDGPFSIRISHSRFSDLSLLTTCYETVMCLQRFDLCSVVSKISNGCG